jgi:hypothetical protein
MTPQEQARTEWEQRQAEWDERARRANAYLDANLTTLAGFRERLTPLFKQMLESARKPFTRRPNVSLRLVAPGEPKAKLIALPQWLPREKAARSGVIDLELLTEEVVRTRCGPALKWGKRLEITLAPWGARRLRTPWNVVQEQERAVGTMADFLENPGAVLARNRDNCAICGRGLTDERSRARGIGPECIQLTDFFLYQTTRSIVEAEQE